MEDRAQVALTVDRETLRKLAELAIELGIELDDLILEICA